MSTSTLTLLRPRLAPPHTPTLTLTQAGQRRAASLLRRPHRPYTFTQLLTLSDGSTFTHRTTSPAPLYKSTRDARNSPLWNPSNVRLANVEEDEAGRLKAFRRKFGRGWDAEEESDVVSSLFPLFFFARCFLYPSLALPCPHCLWGRGNSGSPRIIWANER